MGPDHYELDENDYYYDECECEMCLSGRETLNEVMRETSEEKIARLERELASERRVILDLRAENRMLEGDLDYWQNKADSVGRDYRQLSGQLQSAKTALGAALHNLDALNDAITGTLTMADLRELPPNIRQTVFSLHIKR